MDRCDVLVVGGGPAGSTAARQLVSAGRDVIVLDRAAFPRDKVCTGWITPAVVHALGIDLADYPREYTLQTFTGFCTSRFGSEPLRTEWERPISYGVRRYEFDHWLLGRSGARLRLGEPLASLRRDGPDWVVNDAVRAPVVIGAGGHFCPIAQRLNGAVRAGEAVLAQRAEFPVPAGTDAAWPVEKDCPELFFWPDLQGYGWCVRKGDYLDIGAGRVTRGGLPAAVREFTDQLEARGYRTDAIPGPWKGHAYLLNTSSRRQLTGDGLLLAGDAAGLALWPSGEGILSAVESGLLAADAVLAAGSDHSAARLAPYVARIEARFGPRRPAPRRTLHPPASLVSLAASAVFGSRWLTRRILLERAFLHMHRPALEP
jgi:flavin-dependent dehydrogenase